MDVDAFLEELRSDSEYASQIVHVHVAEAREARVADPAAPLSDKLVAMLREYGIVRLYTHQAQALDLARAGRDFLVATGTASGKSLCYILPVLEQLTADPASRTLMLFPTKALCQDQFRAFSDLQLAAGMSGLMAGVYDGDTPSNLRRRLRDNASVIFSNPDMVHAALMPQHARWAEFLTNLKLIVLDELHVYSGIFGANMAMLLKRVERVCKHYGSNPLIIGSTATVANPEELGNWLAGRPMKVISDDGSPRGRRVTVFWNPPRVRGGHWRSRRSANVEAHELMARLIARDVPTITFSKAKMTAEMIHRYVCDRLRELAPEKISKVTPYRGGYRPEERREIEKRLFQGELMGVSTTPALELGIDVGSLEASIVVGYPGTRASFLQQAGRAGRKERDAIVFLLGLDTSVNQYIMSNPDYIFDRCVESAVIDPENPFVATGHLRCACHELPLIDADVGQFGHYAPLVLRLLDENRKVNHVDGAWYYASAETPQHEISLRACDEANVIIEDVDTGEALGEVIRYDAEPLLHPEAIYMHRGDTYRVLKLDLDRNIATVKREETDYYTQPLGGTDVHHIDEQLREKPLGTGMLYWGEVTAYFNTFAYEKINFYTLDAVSVHGLDLPTMILETMALWIVPPEDLMERVRKAGLDAHSGLRGIGYGTRMLLPLFMTCDTRDFSHTVGSANSPWNAIFIYERYPHGLGYTEKAFEIITDIMPAVLHNIATCPCEEGCPCCVGKPLRQASTWNVERGEASIPSKASALMILEGLIGPADEVARPVDALGHDTRCPPHPPGERCDSATPPPVGGEDGPPSTPSPLGAEDTPTTPSPLGGEGWGEGQYPSSPFSAARVYGDEHRLEKALRRRLERMREPSEFHAIRPRPEIKTAYPEIEREAELDKPDVTRRSERHRAFERDLHKRLAKKLGLEGMDPHSGRVQIPRGMHTKHSNLRPTDFPGRPEAAEQEPLGAACVSKPGPEADLSESGRLTRSAPRAASAQDAGHAKPIALGDQLAARARRRYKKGKHGPSDSSRD